MHLVKENDVYKRERKVQFSLKELITFKLPDPSTFEKEEYDWYLTVALEKSDKVEIDRQLLTRELILGYRWAIREGYNHSLDTDIKRKYDHPKNHNTISGIRGYIEKIKKLSNINV